jgi:hypothetical protein
LPPVCSLIDCEKVARVMNAAMHSRLKSFKIEITSSFRRDLPEVPATEAFPSSANIRAAIPRAAEPIAPPMTHLVVLLN